MFKIGFKKSNLDKKFEIVEKERFFFNMKK